MWEDPIVKEVREYRAELQRRFGGDIGRIFAGLRARQAASGAKVIRRRRVQRSLRPAGSKKMTPATTAESR